MLKLPQAGETVTVQLFKKPKREAFVDSSGEERLPTDEEWAEAMAEYEEKKDCKLVVRRLEPSQSEEYHYEFDDINAAEELRVYQLRQQYDAEQRPAVHRESFVTHEAVTARREWAHRVLRAGVEGMEGALIGRAQKAAEEATSEEIVNGLMLGNIYIVAANRVLMAQHLTVDESFC